MDQVVFRARIIGNSQYSASGLVDLLQSWVATGTASISVNSVRYHIDPTCSITLDSLAAPDCDLAGITTTLATPTTPSSPPTTESSSEVSLASQTGISGGVIGGITIGVIIAALLLLFTVLVAILIYMTSRKNHG